MKNSDVKKVIQEKGIEWTELAKSLHMNMRDFTRRLNGKTVSPIFRKHLLDAIERISQRPEDYYDEYR